MIPLTITAHLRTPPVLAGPMLLDGLLYAGLGAELGASAPGGWAAREDVDAAAQDLPLARVEVGGAWWWAASQATLHGEEQRAHLHRRVSYEMLEDWTSARSVTISAGPDKLLRRPVYIRTEMRRLTWTCVGDPSRVSQLLARVPSVGKYGTHGHGWIERWSVRRGGPRLDAYARDLRLRHLPVEVLAEVPRGRLSRRRLPLTPPYWERRRSVDVLQIREVA